MFCPKVWGGSLGSCDDGVAQPLATLGRPRCPPCALNQGLNPGLPDLPVLPGLSITEDWTVSRYTAAGRPPHVSPPRRPPSLCSNGRDAGKPLPSRCRLGFVVLLVSCTLKWSRKMCLDKVCLSRNLTLGRRRRGRRVRARSRSSRCRQHCASLWECRPGVGVSSL